MRKAFFMYVAESKSSDESIKIKIMNDQKAVLSLKFLIKNL